MFEPGPESQGQRARESEPEPEPEPRHAIIVHGGPFFFGPMQWRQPLRGVPQRVAICSARRSTSCNERHNIRI